MCWCISPNYWLYVQAPHGPSQQALISAAMQQASIAFLPYVSSHGTGTPLGKQANHSWPSHTTTSVSDVEDVDPNLLFCTS